MESGEWAQMVGRRKERERVGRGWGANDKGREDENERCRVEGDGQRFGNGRAEDGAGRREKGRELKGKKASEI